MCGKPILKIRDIFSIATAQTSFFPKKFHSAPFGTTTSKDVARSSNTGAKKKKREKNALVLLLHSSKVEQKVIFLLQIQKNSDLRMVVVCPNPPCFNGCTACTKQQKSTPQ